MVKLARLFASAIGTVLHYDISLSCSVAAVDSKAIDWDTDDEGGFYLWVRDWELYAQRVHRV